MKYLPLLWAALWRKRVRTILTLLSLVTAFLLLGLAQGVRVLFTGGAMNLAAPVLIVQARVSFTNPLPLRILPQIEAIPGVHAVAYSQFFGGVYQDPKNFFPQFATDPERWAKVFPECRIDPAQFQAWQGSRTAAVAGRELMERFGWKVGERIPLVSQIWPQKGGSRAWAFDIVGVVDDATAGSCPRLGNLYLRYDYFDEARAFGQGLAGLFVVRVQPDRAEAIAAAVDAMFENSPEETKTQTEREFTLNFARQVGDLSLILNAIMLAVFFSILMLAGNTMRQAVQERIPEFAILKTIGFTDGGVLRLVLAESLLLCVLGGMLGMLLANLVTAMLGRSQQNFPPPETNLSVWLFALAASVVLALVVGILPALHARRVSIIDALAGR